MRKVELLAPAGDLTRLKWAILYGADAVYMGGSLFGLRANAVNFTEEEMREGVKFAHDRGKKVYITVNITLHQEETQKIRDYLKILESLFVDAIIVSDPAILKMALDTINVPVHISTQQSVLNKEAALYFKEKGASRIVLGRETSKEDIKDIIDNCDIEIETFIHGAMCAGYSGRCTLSNFFTKRDANRGGCSQICRWDFMLTNEDKEIIKGDKPFTFCTKDLSLLQYIPDLIDMGVTSFKIEGRMRSIYYLATVVSIYRRAIDSYMHNPENYQYNKDYERTLIRCANRESIPQFFNHVYDESCQYYNGRTEVSNQDFLGVILSYDPKKQLAKVEQRNYFKVGDTVEIFSMNRETISYKISHIFDENMNPIEVVRHPKEIVYISIKKQVTPNDLMRKKIIDK